MNNAKVFFIALLLILLPSIGICESDGWTGNLNFILGLKYLDEDDWSPLDEQLMYGILLDFRPKRWPLNIAIDYLDSHDSESSGGFFTWRIEKEADTREIDIGIRKIWEKSPIARPYIGGGAAFIKAELFDDRFPGGDDDDGIGYWINAGLYWTAEVINFGFDFRYSKADITLFGEDLNAGGFHAAFMVGFHW